jgi:hypothetical protein
MADYVIRLGSGEIVEVRRNEAKAKPAELEWRLDECAQSQIDP